MGILDNLYKAMLPSGVERTVVPVEKKPVPETSTEEVDSKAMQELYQQMLPKEKDEITSQLLEQNSKERDQYYQDLLTGLQAGAGEFSMQPGQPEIYKGPTKKQLGLTPKAIVDEGPQDFMVEEKVVTPDVLKQQVDLEQELEKLPQIKPEPVDKEQPKVDLNVDDRKKVLESVMLDESGQNLIETVDMFKPYTKPFESKEIGKIYTSNVIDNVLPYLPEEIDKNKFKGLLMHGADKESAYGHNAQTYTFRKTKRGTVGHGGIQQVTTSGFKLNLLNNPSEEAKKMIFNLKEKTGIDINKIKNSKTPNSDIQRFLETPFGSNFAASIFYINNLTNPGESGKAARKLFNSDKYNEKDFRDIFYKGSKKYDEVSKILKDNKVKKLKQET
jgi:hypothetical protein